MVNIKFFAQFGFCFSALLADISIAFASLAALFPPIRAIVRLIATTPARMVSTANVCAAPFATAFHGTK